MSPAGRQVHFKAMRKLASEHPSEKVGAEIRKLYSWKNLDTSLWEESMTHFLTPRHKNKNPDDITHRGF